MIEIVAIALAAVLAAGYVAIFGSMIVLAWAVWRIARAAERASGLTDQDGRAS